ncbi:MAG: hypothetical protein ACREN2_05910 [Candidatus Dormibacteria bacterium]
MTAAAAVAGNEAVARRLAEDLVVFLETGDVPPNLFAPDLFSDVTLPTWRLQASDLDGMVALRRAGHPSTGRVPRRRLDIIPDGFVIELTEAWQGEGGEWTCREMVRAGVRDGRIVELSLYCTGDWSPERIAEHASSVTLLRP